MDLLHDFDPIHRHDETISDWHEHGMFHAPSPLDKSLDHAAMHAELKTSTQNEKHELKEKHDSKLDESMRNSFMSDGVSRRSVEETKHKLKTLKQQTMGAAYMMTLRNDFNFNATVEHLKNSFDSKEKNDESFSLLTQSTILDTDKEKNVRRNMVSSDKKI